MQENEQQITMVKIEKLCKNYKMYNRKLDRLIEALLPFVKKHNTFKAIEDFSLELKKGEVLGILGKNRCREINIIKNDYRCCNTNKW